MIIIKNNKINKKGLIITIIMVLFIVCFMGTISTVSADDVDEDSTVSDEQVDNEIKNEIDEVSAKLSKEPAINSRRYAVYDRISKKVIYGKNEDVKSAMASTTKIMTATVVLENADLNQEVVVSKKAGWTGGSRLGLKSGDKTTIKDLLYGLMLRSGNDAAVALAEAVGGSVEGFAELMNKKAEELELKNTHFVTPHGLDNSEHYTTASELAILTDYAMNNETFKKIVGTKQTTIYINNQPRNIMNTNELLGVLDGVVGVKTGFTNNAGRCLVTETKRNSMDIIVVVLGADTKKNRTQDSVRLIEYTFKNYKIENIEAKVQEEFERWKNINEKRISIIKGKESFLELEMGELSLKEMTLKEGEIDKINVEINCPNALEAPVKEKQRIGTLTVKMNGEILEMTDILCMEGIEKKDWKDYFKEILNICGKLKILMIYFG